MKANTENVLPNFLIVGASKCGTTALYYYLKQHPEIGFPDLKEPKYFSSKFLTFPHNGPGDTTVDKYAVRDFETYTDLFSDLDNYKKIGEASPDYIYYHQKTVDEIKRKLGDIPIIIILRNPVHRAFSAYKYLVRDSREKRSFREALNLEEERLQDNWDFIWAYKKAGEYYSQVKSFRDNFTNVKIIIQEKMIKDTDKNVRETLKFLDLDENVQLNTGIKYNESGRPNNILAKFLLSRNNKVSARIREIMKSIIPRTILEKVASKSLSSMKINFKDEKYLQTYFKEENEKLFDLLGYRIEEWD
ncbi:sulfotransferase family protein [Gracilimonas sp. Q87]|uniref:sulfotransferase family protein n=1 Tax=Gracilimonas sp. Q87 TaxID=3384766 RepID=UPI003983EA8A